MTRVKSWLLVAGAWIVPVVATVLLVVTIFDVPGLQSKAQRNRDLIEVQQKETKENQLLFKFSCTLPLAVAERLDRLIVAALDNPTLTEGQVSIYREYHRDFIRGKDICPPLTRQEQERVAKLLVDLGGRLPED